MLDEDINLTTNKFLNTMNRLYNRCFPIKSKFISLKRLYSPWLTTGLLTSIKHKNKLYKLVKCNLYSKLYYTRYRNKLSYLIKIAKKNHFSFLFNKHRLDTKSTWKCINNIIGLKSPMKNNICLKDEHGNLCQGRSVANCLNNFFTTVASNLVNQLPPTNYNFQQTLTNPNLNSIF